MLRAIFLKLKKKKSIEAKGIYLSIEKRRIFEFQGSVGYLAS